VLDAVRAQTESVQRMLGEKRAAQDAMGGVRAEADRLAKEAAGLHTSLKAEREAAAQMSADLLQMDNAFGLIGTERADGDRLRALLKVRFKVTEAQGALMQARRQVADLERELEDARKRLASARTVLTAEDLENRIALWTQAREVEQEAATLRQQAQGTLACGIVLSAGELCRVADMRDAAAQVLRGRALTGAA